VSETLGHVQGTDLLWAPISAIIVRFLYGSNALAAVNFIEELLPFTDIFPTATLAFILELYFQKVPEIFPESPPSEPVRKKGWGSGDDDVIDITASSADDLNKRDA
jgi:hypothetical protein